MWVVALLFQYSFLSVILSLSCEVVLRGGAAWPSPSLFIGSTGGGEGDSLVDAVSTEALSGIGWSPERRSVGRREWVPPGWSVEDLGSGRGRRAAAAGVAGLMPLLSEEPPSPMSLESTAALTASLSCLCSSRCACTEDMAGEYWPAGGRIESFG